MGKGLKVGDRVAVYGSVYDGVRHTVCNGDRGTVALMHESGFVTIRMPDGLGWKATAHPKQCRRLRKKKKPLRVEGTVTWEQHGNDDPTYPAFGKRGDLDQLVFDQFVGKRTKITVEEITNV